MIYAHQGDCALSVAIKAHLDEAGLCVSVGAAV